MRNGQISRTKTSLISVALYEKVTCALGNLLESLDDYFTKTKEFDETLMFYVVEVLKYYFVLIWMMRMHT